MIVACVGNMGAGKTLSSVIMGYIMHKRMPEGVIVSNFSIEYSDITVDNTLDLQEVSEQHEGVQVLDEIWAWADSRKSGENELFNDMIINSRKRGWIVIYTAQNMHMVDKRLRDNTDYVVIPVHTTRPDNDKLVIHIYDLKTSKRVNKRVLNPEPFYGMYDTQEEVGTDNKESLMEDLIEEATELVESGQITQKNELKSYLRVNKDLSKTDSADVTNEAFRNAEV